MHEIIGNKNSLIETLSNLNSGRLTAAGERQAGAHVLRRIASSLPRTWSPVALRCLSEVSSRLPDALRQRLRDWFGIPRADMGRIDRDYPDWIERFDHVDARPRQHLRTQISRVADLSMISIVMPVYNPRPDHLLAAIRSVRDQIHTQWELCVADDASTDPAVICLLKDEVARDNRIKLVRRAVNGHISAASNSALRLATGQFVALLDHDDILPPHALSEVAARLSRQPDLDVLYSDEDHIDDEGRRSHPYFKPGWNPELMLGQNLISHFGVFRRSLIEKVGGFRVGFEGSQDYDLALRIVAETTAERIAHIPQILYHWRQGSLERTFSESAHERCANSGRRAVGHLMGRLQPGATLEPAPYVPAWTRVVFPIPEPRPLVSVIVGASHSTGELLRCIDGLLNQTDYAPMEVLVTGLANPETGLPKGLLDDPRVRVLGLPPSALNSAATAANGTLLLFLDACLGAGNRHWMSELVSHAIRCDVGAVGAKVLSPNGTVRHAGVVVAGSDVAFMPFVGSHASQVGYFGHLQLTRAVSAVSGGCVMVRRQVFLEMGGLEEAGLPPLLRDVDFCLKLTERGLRNIWTPRAELWSREEIDRFAPAAAEIKQAVSRLRKRWGARLEQDPYWNPNLSHDPTEIGLAFPPMDLAPGSLQAA